MAKINIEYDSETRDAVVTLDGKVLENVSYISIYTKCGDCDGMCTIEGRSKHDGYMKYETIYASDRNVPLSNRLAELLK